MTLIDIDIGTKHRLVAFKRPIIFLYFDCRFMDTLAANFSTDKNYIYFQGKMSHYQEVLKKLTLVQHFINCDSLVFQTGADLLLKVHFLLCVRAYLIYDFL